MKLGYHDVKVISYTAGTNDNGKKLMDFVLENEAGDRVNVQLYFVSPENIRISLEQLRGLGWEKGQPLDAVIGAKTRIEVYSEEWLDNQGNQRESTKAKFVGGKPSIAVAMTKAAAQSWLEGMADPGKKW